MPAEKEPSSKGMTWGLALLFALVIGGIQEDPGGFAIGALLGALLAQVLHLRSRTHSLSEQLELLKRRPEAPLSTQEQPSRPAQPVEPAMPARAPVPQAAQPVAPITPTPAAAPTAATPVPPTPKPPPARPAPSVPLPPTPVEALFDRFMAWFKGGNPLARIGIVILFFGAVFLAKYAAENSLFPIELRFIAIALGAFALLIIGWRLRDKRPVYAQLLQGGGIAGLYLTVFAASRLYHLLPLGFALGLMVVVAVAAAIIAVAQNSLSLAVIGTAGGFLAPVLISTGGGNHVALFSYYTVLNLGVFTVAWFRTWRTLNVLGFLFTFTITGLWRATGYQPHDLASADFFLILFFLMYVGVSILNCVRQPPNLKGYVSGSLVFGLPVVAFTLHATLVSKIEYALAWSALALSAFYLVLGWTLYRTRRETFRLLVEAFAALGVIFASLAIPLAFDTRTTAAMWAVEGTGLLWLGVRQQRKLARAFGALLQVAAGMGYLIGLYRLPAAQPILNSAYLGAVMLGVSGLVTSYWLHRNRTEQARYEGSADVVFALWGVAWWLFGGLHEIDRFLPAAELGGALIYVALTAVVLAAIGLRWRWPLPQTMGLYLPTIAAVVGLSYAANLSHPFAQWGESGWLLLFAVQYALLYLVDIKKSTANNVGVNALHAAGCWLLALLLAWEISWQVEYHASGVWPSLPWGLVPAFLLALIGRKKLVPAWPLARFADVYRMTGAVPLALTVCAWILFTNLTNVGDPSWLPYLPLLNPLDVSVALCLSALGLWWTSLDAQQRGHLWSGHERGVIAVFAALVFLWLNAALIRALHHNWGAPITPFGLMSSTLVQASLSIFWGLLGFTAMTVAARQRWRYVWMAGATLMIVVVAKLFLIDLSNIGTVARITSFLTVGALLLITGYLAPLPPRKESDEVTE